MRPYLPRFFREGDEIELKVVVNNAGAAPLDCGLDLKIFEPETERRSPSSSSRRALQGCEGGAKAAAT